MSINIVAFQPLVALIARILILVIPRLLNYIVAIYPDPDWHFRTMAAPHLVH